MSAIFLQGNSLSILKGLPDDFIHCCVTSPPYFGLRRYDSGVEDWDDGKWIGQLGAEPTPDLYISHLVQIFQEVKRVLRPDGVLWVNIGDSWSGSGKGQMGDGSAWAATHACKQSTITGSIVGGLPKADTGCKPLDMIMIPSLLALALRADGWYLRSIAIWSKNNPMPESVNGWRWERHKVKVGNNGRGEESWRAGATETPNQDHGPDGTFKSDSVWQDCPGCPKCIINDGLVLRKGSWRPTDSYEQILMLTKTNNYFCDKEAVLEDGVGRTDKRTKLDGEDAVDMKKRGYDSTCGCPGGRNMRSVWSFPTKPGKFNHYAAYPPKLPEICIKASTSEKGCCPKCGSPFVRVKGTDNWKATCECLELFCPTCHFKEVVDAKNSVVLKLWQAIQAKKFTPTEQILLQGVLRCEKGYNTKRVPNLPENVCPKEEQPNKVLQQSVRVKVSGQDSANNEGELYHVQRLSGSVLTQSSISSQVGVRIGAPTGYGEQVEQVFNVRGSCTPQERDEVGQSTRESSGYGEIATRFMPEADVVSCLSLLRGKVPHQGKCSSCSTYLLTRTPDSIPCRVLDCFSGAGTTAMVAERLNVDSFSIDTSEEYIQLAKDRLADDYQKRGDEFIAECKRAAKLQSKQEA